MTPPQTTDPGHLQLIIWVLVGLLAGGSGLLQVSIRKQITDVLARIAILETKVDGLERQHQETKTFLAYEVVRKAEVSKLVEEEFCNGNHVRIDSRLQQGEENFRKIFTMLDRITSAIRHGFECNNEAFITIAEPLLTMCEHGNLDCQKTRRLVVRLNEEMEARQRKAIWLEEQEGAK